jgi:hypothetical protein
MGCKEGGVNVHKGRTGVPVILIVGDEAVPMTVGVTKKGGGGNLHVGFEEGAFGAE